MAATPAEVAGTVAAAAAAAADAAVGAKGEGFSSLSFNSARTSTSLAV